MNCIYCQQSCNKSTEPSSNHKSLEWKCNNHSVPVFFVQREEETAPCAVSFKVSFRNKQYYVEMYYPNYFDETIRKDIHFDIYDENGLVTTVTKLPSGLTPENVQQKLPIWLIFS